MAVRMNHQHAHVEPRVLAGGRACQIVKDLADKQIGIHLSRVSYTIRDLRPSS